MHNLDKLKETLEEIEVPYEKLAQGRKQAYQSVQLEKKRRPEWRYRLVLATLCLGMLVVAIRYVPAIIDPARQTSDLEPLGDHQMMPEEFFERLAITEKKNDLTFTLEGVTVEAKYMRIDYTVEAPYDISNLQISKADILQNGQHLNGSKGYHWFDKEGSKRIKEKIELYISLGSIVSHENFELQITFDDEQQTTFEIPFSLENPLPKMPQYKVNETVEVEGQAFTVEEVIVSPLHTVVRFTTSPENDMTLYSIGHIALLDEQGEEWNASGNSPAAFGSLTDGEWEIFLENKSSKIPEKMTLVLEDVNALPKGEDYVEVEFGKNIVLKQPAIGKVDFKAKQVNSITIEEEGTEVRLSHAIDADGERFEMESFSSTLNQLQYTYPLEMKVPVKIYFYDYPNPLHFKQEILIYE